MSLDREPVALSWSGGKDSALALAALREDPRLEVVALMTSVTREYDRISIHGVRRVLLEAQVASAGLPLIEVTLEPQCSNEAYEAAFFDAVARMGVGHPGVETLAFGDLFLEDVRAYREALLRRAGLTGCFPLWGRETRQLAHDFVARGFVAHLACVDTTQLAARFAGRVFDDGLIAELPAGVDPCGERGEFHTFVSAGPIFSQPIAVSCGDVVLRDGRFAYCDILPSPAG
ncbi:hypothetical protein LuPra_02304 [Luteitalea pratensis]|uniref:Diphthamide synthase domain-containing protein n=1 Tax=Luteitalea pratensis TaxID=1855912 RepID=A0A143PLI9_LUTPR|nr:ATP-binding protein [Luteitalea pratensis]AMY09093.1 hypothetical protein LuPra_02304 [Luteitalea pratensis]